MSPLMAVFQRELRLAWSGGGGAGGPAAFLLAAVTLVPLAMGPAPDLIRASAPGILGFVLLLACLQPAERLFGDDAHDGTLELYALSGHSLYLLSLIKTMAFTVAVFWPAPILLAVGGLAYGLPAQAVFYLTLALSLALPGLMMMAGFAGALAAGLKRAGLLIALIAAPLQVPLLVFATSAGRASLETLGNPVSNLLLCASFTLVTLVLCPLGMAWAIRARLE